MHFLIFSLISQNRIYQRKFLGMMVAATWIGTFAILIPTWRGVWGKFGLDTEIGSCSILPDENSKLSSNSLYSKKNKKLIKLFFIHR